jgi:CheY-like chemotaxis protein
MKTAAMPNYSLSYSKWPGHREMLSRSLSRACACAPNSEESEAGILVLFWFDGDAKDFRNAFDESWKQGKRRFILIAPEGYERLLKIFPAEQQPVFEAILNPCKSLTSSALKHALKQSENDLSLFHVHVDDYLAAVKVFNLLSNFSHGGKSDITNQFLAPARLLLDAGSGQQDMDSWKNLWIGKGRSLLSFKNFVFSKLTEIDHPLAKSLEVACSPISRWLEVEEDTVSPAQLESLMLLLTRIRQMANGHAYALQSGADGEIVRSIGDIASNPDAFRILVVDDHAQAWRPIFEFLFKELINANQTVVISFATNFSKCESPQLLESETEQPVRFAEYDLVILDVLLGPRKGTDVLRELRIDFPHLPVLLWTTSRSEELAASASLANGMLLKKTIRWKDFFSTISAWLPRGRALRFHTLPSPYFNHRITNPIYRQLISGATDWCLKQLDSFHALDGSYFRYFTDHGGRHIVKLFDLLEQALRPFLVSDELLSKDPKIREFELTAMCLAVIFHEMGMFPLRVGNRVEDLSTLGDDYLDDIRSLHAVRGMVLLYADDANEASGFWSDDFGKSLGKEMAMLCHPAVSRIRLSDLVAILVGYHARCMKSLSADCFLKSDKSFTKRLEKLKSSAVTLQKDGHIFEDVRERLGKRFEGADALAQKEHIRKLCAVFRFVDAIDITSSRNPALFLIHSPKRRAVQNREYLKRQVCRAVEIRDGQVCVKLEVPAPDLKVVNTILYNADRMGILDIHESLDVTSAKELSNPWSFESGLTGETLKGSIKRFQKTVDCWLISAWEVIMGKNDNPEWVKHLKQIGILDDQSSVVRMNQKGRQIIASITGLAVAGEVLDEYEAIIETGLAGVIVPGRFQWSEWIAKKDETLSKLTILGLALEQYPAGKRDFIAPLAKIKKRAKLIPKSDV